RQARRRTFLLCRLARFQHLFHGVEQALGIDEHQLIELPPLRFSHIESLQGLKVEPDGRDRRLQFVSNRVDEAVVLLVAANFADQKNRIEDKPGYYGPEKNDAEKNFDACAPVEDDPSAADGKGYGRQADAQREEEVNRLLPANDAHREIVAGRGEGVRWKVAGGFPR